MRALQCVLCWKGTCSPKQLDCTFPSSIFATLKRGQDGQIDLLGSADVAAQSQQAATFQDLLEQVDRVFEHPQLAALQQVDVDAVTLRFEDARARRAWTIDGARMRIGRAGRDLSLSVDLAILGGGADAATMSANYSSRLGDLAGQFGVTVDGVLAGDLADFSPAFGWLSALRAPISGALRGGVLANGDLAPLNATLQIAEGVLQPTLATLPVPFQAANTYFTFDPAQSILDFDQLYVDSAWATFRAAGTAHLAGLDSGVLDALSGQFQISELRIDPPGLYPEPLELQGAEFDFRLRPDPFVFDLGQLNILDRGEALHLNGRLEAAPEGWIAGLNADMRRIDLDRLMALWPRAAVAKTRAWLEDNLIAGNLKNLQFASRSVPGSKPDAFFSFDFDEAEVRYLRSFPNIEKASGTASMLRNRFVVAVHQGQVTPATGGDVNVGGSAFIIPDVRIKGGPPARVELTTDGSIPATLALLDLEPINLMQRSDLPIELAEGRASAEITLTLPLRRGIEAADVGFEVDGLLRNVRSERLVEGRSIAAPNLRVLADPGGVEISGKGTFDGIPADVRWRQQLGPDADGSSAVRATVELSPSALDAINVGLPPGTISGLGAGLLDVKLPRDAPPTFSLTSDLQGIGVSIPALNWSLGQGSKADFRVAGSLGPVPEVDVLSLDAPGLAASGRVTINENGGLDQAEFQSVKLGGWLDAPVRLVGRGEGAAPEIRVQGGRLDLRQAAFGTRSGRQADSGPLALSLDRLQITDTIALTDMQGDFDLRRGMQGRFTGKVNGIAVVSGQVEPLDGRSAFRITSDDAGAVFSAAGLLKQARGGKMSLTLRPVGTAGAFNGALTVADTRIKDAPAIAALFNALSVVGLLEQMGGQGLHFSEVEAAFRLTPDRLTLTEASAVGPSIGMSMDGTYDVNSTQMNMRGVFSPIYLINGIGSILTRKGEGLIGFNFRLDGPAENPSVQVNPLSALTPSIFREIFRRPPPIVEVEPGEEPGATPQVQRVERPRRNAPVADREPTR